MSRGSAPAPILPDVVEEHLEELGFLAIQRRKLIVSPDTSCRRLGEHDERIAAHRDGLTIAGAPGIAVVTRALDEAAIDWYVAAAGRVWLEDASPPVEDVQARIAAGGAALAAGWREAFRRTTIARVDRVFPRAAPEPEDPIVRAVRADARVWHGRVSEGDVARFAADPDPALRRSFARAAARMAALGSDAVRSALERLLRDEAGDLRRVALWSLALADAAAGLAAARRMAAAGDAFALRVLGLLGDDSDLPRLHARAKDPAALRALGDLGRASELEFLHGQLDDADPERAIAAADAVLTLCGFPNGVAATFPADPEMARARAAECRGRFGPRTAWLRGLPFPYEGPADDETTESRWRALVRGAPSADPWRAEVPDGFFAGAPDEEAICGE